MKNSILTLSLLFTLSLTAQLEKVEDCKCGEATYPIVGELISTETHETGKTLNYAGIKDDKVYFVSKQYHKRANEEVLYHIWIKTVPVKAIDWRFNDMFSSNSKYETKVGKDGVSRVQLTLGPSFGSSNMCEWIDDQCWSSVKELSPNMKSYQKGSAAWTVFENKEQMLKFTDKVKTRQDELKN